MEVPHTTKLEAGGGRCSRERVTRAFGKDRVEKKEARRKTWLRILYIQVFIFAVETVRLGLRLHRENYAN